MADTMHLPIGTILHGGRYEILRFISSGGFGCTYEAHDNKFKSKTKTVAIKEFFVKDFCARDSATNSMYVTTQSKVELIDRLREKFLDEANALFELEHPNIVRVTDTFKENGTAYYVMEYIDGSSLAKVVEEKGALSEGEALCYVRQVADALGYVHSHNRLHLDVKPQNIMVDSNGRAVLVDFGVSKQYDEVNFENISTLLGSTPGFAPLEQQGNEMNKFSPSTDIYSLGATLYNLVTGMLPPLASDVNENGLPLIVGISAPLQTAISAAMQPRRKDRPQNIGEFLKLLGTAGNSGGSVVDGGRIRKTLWLVLLSLLVCGVAGVFLLSGTAAMEVPEIIPIVDYDEKWGYVDKDGNEVVPCIYEEAEPFSEGMARVGKGGKFGYIDTDGRRVVPCEYDYAYSFSEGLGKVMIGNKYGLVDRNGKEVLPCEYHSIYQFYEGFAISVKTYSLGITDKDGKELFAYKFGFVDKLGDIVAPCRYDEAYPFSEGMAAVAKDGKWGFIDKYGDELIPFVYDKVLPFSEGLACVEKNGKRGYVDKNGDEVIPFEYDYAGPFSEGLAMVSQDGKYGFVDKTGNKVVACKYDDAENFSEGVAWVEKKGRYGILDKTGKEILICKRNYDGVEDFSNGVAWVEKDDKYALVDNEGNELTEFIYDDCDYYADADGVAWVEKDEKYALVDKEGNELTEFIYDDYDDFSEGVAWFERDGKVGLIGTDGREITKCVYDYYEEFTGGLAEVERDDMCFYIDRNGKEYIKE